VLDAGKSARNFGRHFFDAFKALNEKLIDVLQRLREVNLKLNPQKSKLLGKEVLYLGHKITTKVAIVRKNFSGK
jgi:hypothetical protein